MAFPSIHDRAHGGKEVSSPLRAKPIRHFSKDRAHADRLFAGVIGGWNGGIVQKEEQVVLDLGIAFLQASAMGSGGLAGDDTVTEHPGPQVFGKGRHRDGVRSTHSYIVY